MDLLSKLRRFFSSLPRIRFRFGEQKKIIALQPRHRSIKPFTASPEADPHAFLEEYARRYNLSLYEASIELGTTGFGKTKAQRGTA